MHGRAVRMVGPLLLTTLSILAQGISDLSNKALHGDTGGQVSLAEKYRIGLA